jgi:2-polyprenyl-3-methyl-5-hydroxy-6-metoxy-1,4-benzoquinol methylase
MYLNNYESRNELLLEWLCSTVPEGATLLEIGSGDGSFAPEVECLRNRGYRIVGVDPQGDQLRRNPFLNECVVGRIEEVSLPQARFDGALAIYVAEHVSDPEKFLTAVANVLRPGASFFFITPNGDHYFARTAAVLAALGIQERVLRLLRPGQLVDDYHHHAVYRLNRPSQIRRLSGHAGFSEAEFRFAERLGEFACYFPGPAKILPWLWERGVRLTGSERFLGNLLVRLQRAHTQPSYIPGD